LWDEIIRLINTPRKNIFRGNTGRISLTRDGIRNIKARVNIIARVDITITTWISSKGERSTRPNKSTKLVIK
jgi:hypothetical protein